MALKDLRERFAFRFGTGDTRSFVCPGRVNLIGEHIDYNGGYVFPCALTLGTYAVARENKEGVLRLESANFPGLTEVSLEGLAYKKSHGWSNYPKGVATLFKEANPGVNLPGLDIMISGAIPNGAGLSSSASICVLFCYIFNDITGAGMSPVEMALLCQRVENEYIGLNCGIMDQFAVAMGKSGQAMLLNCDTLDFEYVGVNLADSVIIISNTNYRRQLTDSKYNERRAQCEAALKILQTKLDIKNLCDLSSAEFEEHVSLISDPLLASRARHCVYENERCKASVVALKLGDLAAFGMLMNASHDSLRDLYEVTGPHLDALQEGALSVEGVIGSRVTGAGMGGCTVSIVRSSAKDSFIERVGSYYHDKTGLTASFYTADIGDGARRL